MAEQHRNGWVTKWLVGAVWGLITTGLILLATSAIANYKENSNQHTDIRREIKLEDDCLRKEFTSEIKEIRTEQTLLSRTQTKILTILERVENKID